MQSHLLSKSGLHRWLSDVGVPLHIPPEGRDALRRMEVYGPDGLFRALEHLTALGSNWAAAALATSLLYQDANGDREATRAVAVLERPVLESDPYAMYVMGRAKIFLGEKKVGLHLLKRAAEAGFSPATLDLALALQMRGPVRFAKTTQKLLKRAQAKGNLYAGDRLYRIWMSGRAGWMRMLPGVFWFVLNFAVLMYELRCNPISLRVFCLHDRIVNPSIRRAVSRTAE